MLIKTHLLITFLVILLLISKVNHQLIFVLTALIATFIPDIDSRYSSIGKNKISRILQFFTKHRGITHSFIFLLIITLILVFIFPVIALGFFLGYGLHLFGDSFTKQGITPFYPFSKLKSSGRITTGSRIEMLLLFILVIINFFIIFVKFFNI